MYIYFIIITHEIINSLLNSLVKKSNQTVTVLTLFFPDFQDITFWILDYIRELNSVT